MSNRAPLATRGWRARLGRVDRRLTRIVLYGASRSLVEVLLGVRGLVLAGMLGPQLFGVWALFRLILTYAGFVGIGLLRGLEVEVAQNRSPEREATRRLWGRTAAGFTLALFGTAAVALAIGATWTDQAWLRQLLLAVAVGLLLERLWYCGLTYLRASGSLRAFAALEVAQAAAQAALTIGLALVFGLTGAFVGFALASLTALALVARKAPFRPLLEPSRLRAMLAMGVPLSVNLFLSTMLTTADRMIVGAFAGLEALGQYAFAVAVATLGVSAALIVRNVVFPDLYAKLSDQPATDVTRAHLQRTLRPFVMLLAPVMGAGALLLGPVVAIAAPGYLASVPAAGIFVFTGLAQGAVSLTLLGVVAMGRQGRLPLLSLAALALNVGLCLGAVRLGAELTGFAVAALLGRLAYAGGVLALVARTASVRPMRTVVSVLWPIPWCLAALLAAGLLHPPVDLASLVGGLALYLPLTVPLMVVAARSLMPHRAGAGG